MIPPEAAWERLLPLLRPLDPETLPARRAAGRVLAEAVRTTVDVPGLDVSAMDGYALAGAVEPGEVRPVAGVVAAGDAPGFELAPGAAVRIMTGAPVPEAADRVVPVEQTDDGDERVRFDAAVPAGAHIRRRGEVVRRDEQLLPAGTLLTPGALSLTAAHGHVELPVHRAPRVAVLTTGDEVVPPTADPRPGQLRDSHTDFLLAAGRSLGLDFEPLGTARDEPGELGEKVRRGLDSDLLLLTGGVSMGHHDLVEDALEREGCTLLFDRVAIQPGKPLVAARHPRGLVFGLPGNPASVMVGFWLFVRPVLRRLMGSPDAFWHGALAARLDAPLAGAKDRTRFLPAEVRFRDGEVLAVPAPPKGSHDVAAYARGTALVRIPAGAEPKEAGEACEVLPLVDWRGTA